MYLKIHGTYINTAHIRFFERDHEEQKCSIAITDWPSPIVTVNPDELQTIDEYLELALFQGAQQMSLMRELTTIPPTPPQQPKKG